MNNDNSIERFLELDAGRALGDLTADEVSEWKALAAEHGESVSGELPLDDIVSALETAMSGSEGMPPAVKARVQADAQDFSIPRVRTARRNWISHPAVGWAVAACLSVALLIQNSGTGGVNLVGEVESDSDVIRLQFSRLDATYGDISGEVLWSDRLQRGFMKLSGVTPNDPGTKQFQLWIFDPERDTNPVDGGVFDIAGEGEVVVPINAKLKVTDPDAFAITVEQPGGVVVSKREMLLALAK